MSGRAKRAGAERPGEGVRATPMRRRMLLAGILLAALTVVARAAQLQVVEWGSYHSRALDQQADREPLPAARGGIYDRDGVPLAASRSAWTVAVAPREMLDTAAVLALLGQHTKLSAARARRLTRDSWVPIPGRYDGRVRDALAGVPGIHLTRVSERFYPHGELARELLGRVAGDGVALGGLEEELDSILAGTDGQATVGRDSRGRVIPGATVMVREPTPGRDVYLTIDYELQEIANDALRDAVEATGARGGELLLLDPTTGELLAAVSRSASGARGWRAVTDPYEPGSTIKPFTVAMLLQERRVALTDSVYGEDGHFMAPHRSKPIRDVHGAGWMSVADALRNSSNIAMAKLSARLPAERHFTYLRGLGFGTPTAVTFPVESAGLLHRPATWSAISQQSLSFGYEVSVTPLQMALAYGALANGGILMEPRLVREVRARNGRVERAFSPRPVRRVFTTEVTAAIRDVLADVVRDGSGRAAGLGRFAVAGKTGTARVASAGGYRVGAYVSSFAGFFPAEDPQIVFLVKLDEPDGVYYGGATAAPVTRTTLEAALAARGTPLDKRAMAVAASALPEGGGSREEARWPSRTRDALVVSLSAARAEAPPPAAAGVVPDVTGLPLRDAAARLHAVGMRVRAEGSGTVHHTDPAAGARIGRAGVVRVVTGGSR